MALEHNSQTPILQSPQTNGAHVIVFGNEKGGSGKSTSAMHTAIALLRLGYSIGTIDLDARQSTFTRYMANRFKFVTDSNKPLPSPIHVPIERSQAPSMQQQLEEDRAFLNMALEELSSICDFIVIDTPGSDTPLSRLAHGQADTLITPLNDSFIDLDVLAEIDAHTHEVRAPSVYTKMVQEKMLERAAQGRGMRWIVMRNRLSHINAKNKQQMSIALNNVAEATGFLIAPGFGERVIFRELFLKGLTLLDLTDDPTNTLSLSQISARQEVRALINSIDPHSLKPLPDGKE